MLWEDLKTLRPYGVPWEEVGCCGGEVGCHREAWSAVGEVCGAVGIGKPDSCKKKERRIHPHEKLLKNLSSYDEQGC